MSQTTIDLHLQATGENQVQQAFENTGRSGSAMERILARAARLIGRDLKDVERAADGADKSISNIGKGANIPGLSREMRALAESVKRVGDDNGFERLNRNAERYFNSVEKASEKTRGLYSLLERGRNAGAMVTMAGAGGILLANQSIGAYQEGEGINEKLRAMLSKQGQGDQFDDMNDWAGQLAFDAALTDDDPIKDAAAGLAGFGMQAERVKGLMPGLIGQSRLYGQSLDGVSEAVGRAFAKGDLDSLARIGVTLTEEQKSRMKALEDSGASMAEKQAAMYEVLKESFDKYALSMTEGLSESEIAANRFALQMDDLQTNVGKGAAAADMSIKTLGARIIGMVAGSPSAQEAGGWLLTMGSYGATATGGIITLTSQIGMAKLGLNAMGIQGVASLGAIRVAALATLPVLGALALAVTAAAAAWVAYQGSKDAASMTDTQLKEKWGPLGEWWSSAGRALGDDSEEITDDDRKGLELENKARAKRGQAPKTMAEYKGHSTAEDEQSVGPAVAKNGLDNAEAAMAKAQAAMVGVGAGAPVAIVPTGAEIKAVNKGAKPKKTDAEREAERQAKADASEREKYNKLLSLYGGDRGEANVSLAMGDAKKVFGSKDARALSLFKRMDAAGIEKAGGFESEAAREAARRVLFEGKEAKGGKGTKGKAVSSKAIDVMAFVRAGGRLADLPADAKAASGESASSGDSGGRYASFELTEGRRVQGTDGTEKIQCSGWLTLKRGGGTSVSRLGMAMP